MPSKLILSILAATAIMVVAVCVLGASAMVADIITVTSPNGGESWTIGSLQEITWTGSAEIDNVTIEYSTDNGATWKGIVGPTANDGSYHWLLPYTPSDDCLIRVSASDGDLDPRPSDVSDQVFSIVGSTIAVRSPNGGERWEVGSVQQVTWASAGTIDHVTIEYSTDNGTTWKAVVGPTGNDGSYDWLVPDTPSNDCLIRVSSANGDDDPRPSDVSDQVFSIVIPTCYDFDNSGQVDIGDIQQVASRWRTSREDPDPDDNPETPNYDALYDIDKDGDIDVVDIMLVLRHWGEICD